jgi:hypothetical protein
MEVLATCHVHSHWSYDGSWTLKDLAEKFSRRGCQVLMMTEHDRGFSPARLAEYREACVAASSQQLLVVPGIEYSDPANPYWAERLLGIELWNRKYDGWAPSETSPALLESSGAVPFAGLDFHTDRQSFPLTMALELNAGLNEESIIECLRSRRCSARAMGIPLDQTAARAAVPFLGVAEQSRKALASLVKRKKPAAAEKKAN